MDGITLDVRMINSSGIGVYIQQLTEALICGYKQHLKLLYHPRDKKYFEKLQGSFDLIEFDADIYSLKELYKSPAKTWKSSVFWSPHYNIPVLNFASKLKVVTVHDVFHLAFYRTLNVKQKLYAKYMLQRAITSSDLVFTVSEFSKSEILRYTKCDPQKIRVVYNGIDFEKFNQRYDEDLKRRVLDKYNIRSPFILFVGNVKPHKNLQAGLQGFKKFVMNTNGRFADYKFVIAGRRDGFITGDEGMQMVVDDPFFSKSVQFTGWVDDDHLPVLYQNASLFIFPSLYEGFGFPPLEAMSAKCPVVSSNLGCMKEVYGNAAQFFDPRSADSIAEALAKVASDTSVREELVKRGIEQAKKYSWENAIKLKFDAISEFL